MAITTQSNRTSEQSSTHVPRRRSTISEFEHRVASIVRPYSLTLLRVALGVVFLWFGALKVFDVTPVARLVADTVPFLDASWFVPAFGAVEVLLGVALIVGRFLTLVCVALVGHLAGTFLVLVTQPDAAFQDGNPLLLTTVGEFVVKNIVLVAAALVLASRLTAHRETPGTGRGAPASGPEEPDHPGGGRAGISGSPQHFSSRRGTSAVAGREERA